MKLNQRPSNFQDELGGFFLSKLIHGLFGYNGEFIVLQTNY